MCMFIKYLQQVFLQCLNCFFLFQFITINSQSIKYKNIWSLHVASNLERLHYTSIPKNIFHEEL